MKKGLSLFFPLIFTTTFLFAQKQGNQWYFGTNAALDFNTGVPVPVLTSAMSTGEGCASIADKTTGQLLFYSDGSYIWDKTNSMMPATLGGTIQLGGNSSSTQSAVIVPKPGSNNLYYLFTVGAEVGFAGGNPGVSYSIVDMNLNGGLGDLSTLNQPLLDSACEKIASIYDCNSNSYWVVAHRWNTNKFYAYKITNSGISAPVITSIGLVAQDIGSGIAGESIGYLKFSPNGQKLAAATYININKVEIFDFNLATGVLSNVITDSNFVLNANDGPYGVSFSPDNSKLYVSYYAALGGIIYQYDMNAGSANAIVASRTALNTQNAITFGALQIAPDGKIYVAAFGSSLSVINTPNALGAACNFQIGTVNLGGIGTSTFGLPDIIESFLTPPVAINLDTTICAGNSVQLNTSGGTQYSWSPTTGLNNPNIANPIATPTTTTTYAVAVNGQCSSNSASTTINIFPSANLNAGADVTIEGGSSTQLTATGNVLAFNWSPPTGLNFNNIAAPIATPSYTTTYTVSGTDANGCSSSDEVVVTVKNTPDIVYPNAFSPNGDIKNQYFIGFPFKIANLDLKIFNRWGQMVFESTSLTEGWDGTFNGTPQPVGVFVYYATATTLTGSTLNKQGNFTLIR